MTEYATIRFNPPKSKKQFLEWMEKNLKMKKKKKMKSTRKENK